MLRFLLLVACCFFVNASARAENWPEFRGPTGQGVSTGKNLPTEWSTTKNVAWKQPIPGKGWSSPVVMDGKVYLTTAVPIKDGKPKDQSLMALCLDAATGKLLWQTEVFHQDGAKAPKIHNKNSHASPTPLIDGDRLYVHFGHQGTAALDLKGEVLWRSTDVRYNPVHGNGGSPILAAGRLVFTADGGDKPFIAALDPATGKVVWKTDRKTEAASKFSFGTPLLITVKGQPQIVSPASDAIMAYDPKNGAELWRASYSGYSVIPRPVFGHGMVFFSTGYDRPRLLAVRVDGTGDVTKTHIAWSTTKGAPNTPSPLLVGDELYIVSDGGFASCLDARTGKLHWHEHVGGDQSASPTYADGKIYFQSEDGVTSVVKAATQFKEIRKNLLNERTYASYAIADGAIYLRTEEQLYKIANK